MKCILLILIACLLFSSCEKVASCKKKTIFGYSLYLSKGSDTIRYIYFQDRYDKDTVTYYQSLGYKADSIPSYAYPCIRVVGGKDVREYKRNGYECEVATQFTGNGWPTDPCRM